MPCYSILYYWGVTTNIQLANHFCLTLFSEGCNVILFVQASLAAKHRAYPVKIYIKKTAKRHQGCDDVLGQYRVRIKAKVST